MLIRSCEGRCVGIVGGIVRDALSQGDLELPPEVTPEDLVFGLWSMSFGAFTIIATSDSLTNLGIKDPPAAVRLNIAMILDGYGWRPLSSDHDYNATRQRIAHEVFSHELQQRAAG